MSSIFRKNPYNKSMEIFCERLKELRKSWDLSQKELANILQTNNSSVCDWERGSTQPDLLTLIKIAVFFDVTSDYLLGLEDETGAKVKLLYLKK